jgi:hypothetical protein
MDIQRFVAAILDPASYETLYPGCGLMHADTNADGLINMSDYLPFVQLLLSTP